MAGCCLLMMAFNPLKAQYWALDIGYTGSKVKLTGLNQVFDKYNSKRSYLENKLKDVNYLDGLTLGFGFGGGHLLMEFRANFINANRYATGVDGNPAYPPGAAFRRDIKVRQRNAVYTIGTGKVFRGSDTDLGLVFGLRSELGSTKIFTRVYQDGTDVPEYEEPVVDELLFRSGPTLIALISPREGLIIQMHTFYMYSLFGWDAYDLDRKLHGGVPDETESPNHALGFALTFGFGNL